MHCLLLQWVPLILTGVIGALLAALWKLKFVTPPPTKRLPPPKGNRDDLLQVFSVPAPPGCKCATSSFCAKLEAFVKLAELPYKPRRGIQWTIHLTAFTPSRSLLAVFGACASVYVPVFSQF